VRSGLRPDQLFGMTDAVTERTPTLFTGLSTGRKSGYPLSTTCCIRSWRH